jgi:acyl-CoA reductase-like NAD-dependent aldehyde dehydrogenase
MSYAGIPSLPFGGSGDSGFGRIHGADGLREFARPKSIARQRMKPLVNLTSFTRTDADVRKFLAIATLLHGRRYRRP